VTALAGPLRRAGRYARWLLVAGLVLGVSAPGLAAALKPWLGELVAATLFIAALRIGPRQALGAVRDLPMTLGLVLAFQLAMPLLALGALGAAGWLATPLAVAVALMLSASPIAGSPSLTVLVGHDPAPALRLVVLGTLLLPLTVLPVLWLMPVLGTAGEVLAASARLLAVIALAVGGAFALRAAALPDPAAETIEALDGLAALVLMAVIVGLMSAFGPALRDSPGALLGWLGVAAALNLGLQAATKTLLARRRDLAGTVAYAIIAGNRNIALFLVALPAEVTDPVLVFIAAYQLPMYLTPVLLRGFYARVPGAGRLNSGGSRPNLPRNRPGSE
jgi:hypothetical protein